MSAIRYTCPLCKIPSFTLTDAGGGGALSKHHCSAKNWSKLTAAECKRAFRSPDEYQMPEALYTCPECGRQNFTRSGITSHRCPAWDGNPLTPKQRMQALANRQPASMPKTKSTPATSALVVLSDNAICTTGANLTALQKAVLAHVEQIRTFESSAALGGVVVGIGLRRVKASLKRGEFLPWIKANLDATGYRQCAYYMRLAGVFVEEVRLSKPEILALPAGNVDLAVMPADADARRFMEKALQFVGDLSLNELFDKHGIKDKKPLGGARSGGPDEKIDPERLAEMKREEISEVLSRARQLVDENIFQHLKPEERRVVIENLETLVSKAKAALKSSPAS